MYKNGILAHKDWYVFLFPALVGSAFFLLCGYYMRFQVRLNDFWGILFYGRHLAISQPASLHNGFFPIGYPLFLHFLPYSRVPFLAFVLDAAFAGLYVGCISSVLFSMRESIWGVILVSVGSISYPLLFRYANTIGPYMGAAACTMGGVWLLWKAELQAGHKDLRTHHDILAGLLLGLAALFRSEAIVSGVAFLLAYGAIMGMKKLWARRYVWVALVLVYLVQVTANLVSGHGALEGNQNFIAYIAFYGMDWWHIPPESASFSLVAQLLKDPIGFVGVYFPLFLKLVAFALPSILCALVLSRPVERKFAWFVFCATVLYAIPVAVGTAATDRGPLPLLGTAIACTGLLILELQSRGHAMLGSSIRVRGLAIAILTAAALWIGKGWYSENQGFLSRFRRQSADFRSIERTLVAYGMKEPSEVFTDTFDLYFPDMPPFQPHTNGGWYRISLWGYGAEFPELPTDSWGAFISSCSANQIKFLVLTPGAGRAAGFLDAVYKGSFQPNEIRLVGQVRDTKIFAIEPGDATSSVESNRPTFIQRWIGWSVRTQSPASGMKSLTVFSRSGFRSRYFCVVATLSWPSSTDIWVMGTPAA